MIALSYLLTRKTSWHNAQTLHATHPNQTCKMIQPSHHPHWRRNTCFLMSPSMTWNTVPLGGHAHSNTIEHAAPPSQHFIEQARTATSRRSVSFSNLTLRWRRKETNRWWPRHVALHKKCWMNWSLTHGVERTSTKKRQRARNMISS